ncbi:TRAP transporter small permease [Thermodesulfobacteriota bacterium]
MNIEKLNAGLQRWIGPLSRLMSHVSSLILFLMMILTILDVVLRKMASKSILGTVELTEFMLVILVFFALAQTETLDGHVKVDLIMSRFSKRVQSIMDMITQFVCFILSLLITWSSLDYSEKMRLSEEVTQDLLIPIYPFIYFVALGCFVLSFTLLIKFFMATAKVMES